MQIAEKDIHYYNIGAITYTMMWDDAIHKYFYAGVPIAELARARSCSEKRIKELVKRYDGELQVRAFNRRVEEQVVFDKKLAKLDPAGNSAITMAYLQPLRAFLQNI